MTMSIELIDCYGHIYRMNQIVYNSDLIIHEPDILSSLCVFYDRVNLPFAGTNSRKEFVEIFFEDRVPAGIAAAGIEGISFKDINGNLIEGDQDIRQWEQAKKVLFDEAVICRLPKPTNVSFNPYDLKNVSKVDLALIVESLNKKVISFIYEGEVVSNPEKALYVRQDHVYHFIRSDVELPNIYLTDNITQLEVIKAVQAHSIFKYLVPKLGDLHPEEILEVRRKVSDNREGFSMHLQKLSYEIKSLLSEEADYEELHKKTDDYIKGKLIPDYHEFVRQLKAEKTGFWGKVLDSTSKVLEIDAPIWTPKFYGQLAKALGISLKTASSRKENFSNRSQTFTFMKKVQKHGNS